MLDGDDCGLLEACQTSSIEKRSSCDGPTVTVLWLGIRLKYYKNRFITETHICPEGREGVAVGCIGNY